MGLEQRFPSSKSNKSESSSLSQQKPGKGSPPATTPSSPVSNVPVRHQRMNFNWPLPDFQKPHFYWRVKSTFAIFIVGIWSKSILSKP